MDAVEYLRDNLAPVEPVGPEGRWEGLSHSSSLILGRSMRPTLSSMLSPIPSLSRSSCLAGSRSRFGVQSRTLGSPTMPIPAPDILTFFLGLIWGHSMRLTWLRPASSNFSLLGICLIAWLAICTLSFALTFGILLTLTPLHLVLVPSFRSDYSRHAPMGSIFPSAEETRCPPFFIHWL